LFEECTDEQLFKVAIPEVLLPSVRKIKSLADLEKLEPFLPADAFENLFYLADGANIDLLIAETEEGKLAESSPEEKTGSINNQRSFIELTDDQFLDDIQSGTLHKWKYYLHPSQRRLVDAHFNGPVKVSGGAGTGKTVVALHRLKYLASLPALSTKPILFTTFTKSLTENLKDLAQDLAIPADRIRIENMDALAFGLLKKYQLIDDSTRIFGLNSVKKAAEVWEEMLESELIGYDKSFLMREYEDVVLLNNVRTFEEYLRTSRVGRGKALSRRQRKEVWDLLEKFRQIKEDSAYYYKEEVYNLLYNYLTENGLLEFGAIIVDELQDFSNVELRLIRALVEEKPNDLFLVGDPLQKIYDRKISFSKVGIQIRGKRSRRLRINYRTTEEIKRCAVSIIQECAFDDFDGEEEARAGYVSLYHGQSPQYLVYRAKEEEIEAIYSQIKACIANGSQHADICVASRTRDGVKEMKSYLHKLNIPYFETTTDAKKGSRQGIRLLTFHSMKGLEFRHVFLMDINSRTLPLLPAAYASWEEAEKEAYLRSEKALMYVACTRAVQTVQISGIGNKSDWLVL
jgi:superfamily I DNA/RNA helicase